MAAKSSAKEKTGYVDGFVIPIPVENLVAYRKIAKKASEVWLDHGALDYYEAAGEDLEQPFGKTFPQLAKGKPGETVIFAWITFKSRAHRDKVNKAVMQDERMKKFMEMTEMPFDMKRMAYGGFKVLVGNR